MTDLTHGTRSAYNRGDRCPACKEANAVYMREYNRSRRPPPVPPPPITRLDIRRYPKNRRLYSLQHHGYITLAQIGRSWLQGLPVSVTVHGQDRTVYTLLEALTLLQGMGEIGITEEQMRSLWAQFGPDTKKPQTLTESEA